MLPVRCKKLNRHNQSNTKATIWLQLYPLTICMHYLVLLHTQKTRYFVEINYKIYHVVSRALVNILNC